MSIHNNFARVKKIIALLIVISLLSACSTTGGIYKKDDEQNGKFSFGRTLLTAATVIATAALVSKTGVGNWDGSDYAWDYFPGNEQWACRNKGNGEFADLDNCSYKQQIDNWP